jgi:histidyl-tRNA synthetase
MAERRHVESVFRDTARTFGFGEVATPVLESAELFIRRSGPAIVDEMYQFEDKGGRLMALRPEFTASVIRFFVNEMSARPKPLKLYYFGPCFRYDQPQRGRYREFYHFGAEIIGGAPLDSDAETVALAALSLRATGLRDLRVRIGHVGVLRDLLPYDRETQARLLHLLDKREHEAFQAEMESRGEGERGERVVRIAKLRGDRGILEEAVAAAGEEERASLEYLKDLGDRLALYGAEAFEYDLGVVRGLDYYNGMVFEVDSPRLGAEKQVCGGGSYALTEILGGDAIFTTGFAIGFERVMLALAEEEVPIPTEAVRAYVVPIGEPMRPRGLEVLRKLREAGISADMDLIGRGPSKNLDHANAIGAEVAVLVGEREWTDGKVAVKDLESGEQRDVALDALVADLKR